MRLYPVVAFVVTALVMTVVLGGIILAVMLDFHADNPERFAFGWPNVAEIFGFSLLYVAGTGLVVGLPLLALLRWMGLSRRLWALMIAGFFGGLVIVLLSLLLPYSRLDWRLLEPALIFCGFGMASGLTWWLLTCGTPRAPAAEHA